MHDSHETRLTQTIITVLAVFARPEGNWMSIAALVALLSDLRVDPQTVRSAISRMKRRGTLVSEKRQGIAGYSISASTLEVLAEGDVRIFERTRAVLADGWVLAVFSVPERERARRHELRASLTRLGFGTVTPGVWIAPGTMASEARHALDRQELSAYVDLFVGEYATSRDLSVEIGKWWDLDELARLYADFLRTHRDTHRAALSKTLTAQEAFERYVPMLTQWRRLPYRDPGLPLELLSPQWKGESARTLFDEMNAALQPLARRHVRAVTRDFDEL